VNDTDVEEGLGSSSEFITDLNAEYHEKALLANQERFYKRFRRVSKNLKDYKVKYKGLKAEIDVLTKKIDVMSKGKSEKGIVAESFDWDEELVSFDDEGVTKVKAFMAITEDEPVVGKGDARSGQ
nr:hypothetical protein [Tanacetum cinerariifolium]